MNEDAAEFKAEVLAFEAAQSKEIEELRALLGKLIWHTTEARMCPSELCCPVCSLARAEAALARKRSPAESTPGAGKGSP